MNFATQLNKVIKEKAERISERNKRKEFICNVITVIDSNNATVDLVEEGVDCKVINNLTLVPGDIVVVEHLNGYNYKITRKA